MLDRRVKIVATIGPAIYSEESLSKAIAAGMNVARLNFSHGSYDDHQKAYDWIRTASKKAKKPVSILQDLQGPKVRVGKFENGSIELKEGEIVELSSEFSIGKSGKIAIDFPGLVECCKPGTRILMDDGLMELTVTEIKGTSVFAKVLEGGILKDRKGVNVPGAQLPIECLTEKDLADLDFGLSIGVDYVALSFVRKGDDIRRLRSLVEAKRPGTRIVAKIEMYEALQDLEEIVKLSDAVMVARGDLAVEVGQTMLPSYQKEIIRVCNRNQVPVITATQMLDSMVSNPRPTRAEITDVANAVLDGSDALMLSAETATGKHPFRCIQTMSDIICEVEKTESNYYRLDLAGDFLNVAEAIAASACMTAQKLHATAIVCLTTSGKTATMISSYRPHARIIAVTDFWPTLDRLQLIWGIQTHLIPPYANSDEALSVVEKVLLEKGLVQKGEKIIVTLGLPVRNKAKTNTLRVYNVGEDSLVEEK